MTHSKQTIGFIGLGRMGRGMAANILKSGAELIVLDPIKEAVQTLAAQGARPAGASSDSRQVSRIGGEGVPIAADSNCASEVTPFAA